MKILPALLLATLVVTSVSTPIPLLPSAMDRGFDVSKQQKPSTIKVLIANGREKVLLESKGRFLVYNPINDSLLTSSPVSKFDLITATEEGLQWGEFFPGVFQMRIVPGDSQATLLVNGTEYKGCVEIYDVSGKLCVINEIDIERYLKATVASAFPQKCSEEVLEAVAIAARTNACYIAANSPSDSKHQPVWHVDGRETGYLGNAFCIQNPHVDRAINRTRNMILTYHNAPFPATWTKDSAGKTAPFSSIFRKETPSPEGVQTPFAAKEKERDTAGVLHFPKQILRML